MSNSQRKADEAKASQPSMDDVLKRMLSCPPKQHNGEKPAGKPAQKKPAK